MKERAFAGYHPVVNFVYFVLVLTCAMVILHPVCLGISLLCAAAYAVLLVGRAAFAKRAAFLVPMMLAAALLNPAFNHRGRTILGYLPGGNPLTLESVLYGAAAAVMLAAVLCWFSCFQAVMTSDKIVYLFGRAAPVLSLLLAMVLRFVPRLGAQLRRISDAQRCIGRDVRSGGILRRARCGVAILSILVTWALENAVETADSMKSRGYGLPGRTAFSVFRFEARDGRMLCAILCAGAYLGVGAVTGGLKWRYFPAAKFGAVTPYSVSILAVYLLLCALPVTIQILEARKWNALRSGR